MLKTTTALLLTLMLLSSCRFPLFTDAAKDAAIRLVTEAVRRSLPRSEAAPATTPRRPAVAVTKPAPVVVNEFRIESTLVVRCPRLSRRVVVTS